MEPVIAKGVTGGVAFLEDAAVERLQVVADIVSKSALLSLYEKRVAGEFDRIEPLAVELDRSGRIPGKTKQLLKYIGSMLLVEQRMVGRAEITEKPEVLWDNPALEGLFVKLEDEFEIRERHAAIERKLRLISNTANTVLELLSSKHSLRVEWYILLADYVRDPADALSAVLPLELGRPLAPPPLFRWRGRWRRGDPRLIRRLVDLHHFGVLQRDLATGLSVLELHCGSVAFRPSSV